MTLLITTEQMQATERRFDERRGERAGHLENLKHGPLAADTRERVRKRLARLNDSESMSEPGAGVLALERVLGNSDFMPVSYFERGAQVARSIARIEIRNRAKQTVGYGTGFLVAPGLLMTNNHVLSTTDEAALSVAEFDYANDPFGRRLTSFVLDLDPQACFITDKRLDFTLVALRDSQQRLAGIGYNPLIEAEGKVIIGECLTIVQHPSGQLKQVALRENQLIDVLQDHVHYRTDTAQGSSGSPVFNDQWELIALHHMGVPRRNEAGRILMKDGSFWQDGLDDSLIDWVANEGVRASRIIAFLRSYAMTSDLQHLTAPMFQPIAAPGDPPAAPAVSEERRRQRLQHAGRVGADGVAHWTIPLHVSVSLGLDGFLPPDRVVPAAPATPVLPPPAPQPAAVEERISIDPNYENRQGYDEEFLGSDGLSVPLPALSADLEAKAAPNSRANPGDPPYLLRYHHFSVVMNQQRRLAFFTGVNIDGRSARALKRERDFWIRDPRLEDAAQAGEDVYRSNPLDRGHLVRRLDPAWGASNALAKVANDDTFHFTNCSPQHQDFNQGSTLWAGLEDYILKNAKAHDLKVSVFTGPVFKRNDPPYRGIRLPLQFWKIVAMVTDQGNLSATAYLLSQKTLVQDLEEDFSFGAYRTYQVTVRKVEELSKLDFGDLGRADPLAAPGPEVEAELAATGAVELSDYSQIQL